MAWQKSPDHLVELFDQVVPKDTRIERRKMFGYPAAFLNGHLFAGLHQENFVLKLDTSDREKIIAKLQAKPFMPMPGRAMREYVVLPASVLTSRKSLSAWLARSVAYVSSLPPKEPSGGKKPIVAVPAGKPAKKSRTTI